MDAHSPTESTSPTTNANVRNTILNTFLRGRPRNSSQSHIQVPNIGDPLREMSPSPPGQQPPPSPNTTNPVNGGSHRRRGVAIPSPAAVAQSQSAAGQGWNVLRRRRSAGQIPQQPPTGSSPPLPIASRTPTTNPAASPNAPGTHRIRLVPHLESRRSLKFDAISRDLKESDPPLRIGRFTDRSGLGLSAVNALGTNKLAFKSKVVSRAHAEIWVSNGKFFIKDTKSSSGTFLNHTRLSLANSESRAFPLKDGDLLQLGVDYQGGHEDIYKSVKIRVEIGREWQMQANAFNTNALKNLKALALATAPSSENKSKGSVKGKSAIPDCCICLFAVTIHQALFIAPCSHTFHYKCIRPLLESHHPAFSCPLCRTFADLDQDVEIDADPLDFDALDDNVEGGGGRGGAETEVEGESTPSTHHLRVQPPRGIDESEENVLQPSDDDEEMVDVNHALPAVPSEEDIVLVDENVSGEGELPPSPVHLDEGMGGVESDASGREFGMVSGPEDGDRTIGSKRKR